MPPPLPRIDIEIPFTVEFDAAPLLSAVARDREQGGHWFGLRERLAHLGLAQGFDELLCLPHLTGVEPLLHQIETVRKVLKQFRGRVLLADEVGLGKTIEDSPVTPAQAAELLTLTAEGTLSGTLAKQVFEIMLETGGDPAAIVEARGLRQTSDTGAIEKVIAEVMAANEDKVAEYRGGKDKLFGFFVGQTMKAMAGKANPAVVNDLLRTALD